eukprot:1437692-Heterocapsa_arctica.AAC.1
MREAPGSPPTYQGSWGAGASARASASRPGRPPSSPGHTSLLPSRRHGRRMSREGPSAKLTSEGVHRARTSKPQA